MSDFLRGLWEGFAIILKAVAWFFFKAPVAGLRGFFANANTARVVSTGRPRAVLEALIKTGHVRRGDHPSEGAQFEERVSLVRRMVFVAYTLRHEDPDWLDVEAIIAVAAAAPMYPLTFVDNWQWAPPWKWDTFASAVYEEARRDYWEAERARVAIEERERPQ